MIAGFLSFGRKSLLAHPLAETFLHLKWLVRPYLKDAEQNLVNISHFPVRLEDSDDEHAALCSLPHLLHWAGSLDNNRQAPPHRRLVRKDQGGAVGGGVGLVRRHLHLHRDRSLPRDWTGFVRGGQVSSCF